jgi:zinc transport system substrate-binding protein
MLPCMKSLWALICLAVVASGVPSYPSDQPRLKVLTTFLPVYTFAANVAGDIAEVESLSTINASPHDFQFSPPDIQKVNAADLIIVNGLGLELEAKLEPVLKTAGKLKNKVEMSAGLEPFLISSGSVNPHVWLDPVLASHCVTNILRALQSADPAHAPDYASNAAKYVQRLQAVHREIETRLAPVKGAPIVTHHDAFAYFARRYQLRIVGVIEEVPEVTPGAKYLANLQRRIQSEHVRVIFAEANHSSKLARQLAADLRLRMAVLDTLENGKPSAAAYEQGMRENLKTMKRELADYASPRAQ